jgi:DNA invertase Pin-like site-specific DNA recombinase
MLIGYARVSTVDQNLALQRDALTEAGCAKIFTEQMSGAVADRPALHDALEFARSGDTLIVWKLDRVAHSMKQLIETIENLRLRGIGFRSLTEALDTTTAQGRPVFHMFGALAEFERRLIRERTQAGLAAARRAGRTGGRPPKLTDDDIGAAKPMLANHDIGVTQIAHRLGVSPATLYRYIPAARTANTPKFKFKTTLCHLPSEHLHQISVPSDLLNLRAPATGANFFICRSTIAGRPTASSLAELLDQCRSQTPDFVGILDSRLDHDQLRGWIDADALAVGADERTGIFSHAEDSLTDRSMAHGD